MKEYNNSSFFALVRDFLTKYLPDECACSANTITSYQKTLNLYFSYVCGVRKIKIYQFQPSFVTRNSVADFLNHVETVRGCSVSTRNQRLSAIRSFLKYAAEQDSEYVATYIEISLIPTKKKEIVTDISFFSEEALAAILAVPNPHKPTEARDLLFMVVLYDTGARIQELLDLHLGDIRISKRERYVMVTGKGGKRRNIPLMEKTAKHVQEYIKQFQTSGQSDDLLFYTVRGGCRQKMSQDNVTKFIKRYAEIAREKCIDVPENIHPHMFRHSRAMHLYRSGMPLSVVSEWLGHAQLETTIRFYANADLAMKQSAIEKATSDFSPLVSDIVQFQFDDADDAFRRMYGLM